ncbi:MAG TPA: MFS transporter [Stellaceae bacterium]|nr:MFS transporter [Stellaceae bacterium]
MTVQAAGAANRATIETDIPARLDALLWNRFHTLVIAGLGITWILDGLEVTLVGSLSGALKQSQNLNFGDNEIGLAASFYLAGAVVGGFGFGWLTDKLGRKRLFFITLGLYVAATAASGLAWNFWSFAFFRLLTGAGIGGEYTAINSAIQEFIPARYRGRTDLAVNGSFWIGAALGAGGAALLLQPGLLPPDIGWRVGFGIGAALGLGILALRSALPESPRWLMVHRRGEEAERIVRAIEAHAHAAPDADRHAKLRIRTDHETPGPFALVAILFRQHTARAILGLVLMGAQAFFFNAIFFTYALVLARFYGVKPESIGLFILPFAAANFLGPLLLGPLFDSIGRKTMIAGCFAATGVLLLGATGLFATDHLNAVTQTVAWTVIFFFGSAAASAAYLTVGESFPLEMRALAIAVFYAIGTALGGIVGPGLFAYLVAGGREPLAWGYVGAAGLLILAALVEIGLGVAAERRSLEDLARPLSAEVEPR